MRPATAVVSPEIAPMTATIPGVDVVGAADGAPAVGGIDGAGSVGGVEGATEDGGAAVVGGMVGLGWGSSTFRSESANANTNNPTIMMNTPVRIRRPGVRPDWRAPGSDAMT
jgi:hypothetical protein